MKDKADTKEGDTIEQKLVKLKDIFNSDVVVTLGVQKATGRVDLLNCEKSNYVQQGEISPEMGDEEPPTNKPMFHRKKLADLPTYLG